MVSSGVDTTAYSVIDMSSLHRQQNVTPNTIITPSTSRVAQWIERSFPKRQVVGSNPISGVSFALVGNDRLHVAMLQDNVLYLLTASFRGAVH